MEKKYYNNLIVSSSPHHVNNEDTQRIMGMVIAALIPSLAVSTYVFGGRVLALTAVCVIASVLMEFLWNKAMKKPQTVGDLSAALTGLLIAFNVPSNLPFYIAIIGCAVAIILVKGLFGGLGHNLFNPAITARIVLFIAFATQMTTWPVPSQGFCTYLDATTGATPLSIMKAAVKAGDASILEQLPSSMDMLLGNMGGCLGEVSALAIIIGLVYMLAKKIITWHIPISIIATVFVFSGLMHLANPVYASPATELLTGGLLLGAVFMATDYVTSPMTKKGQLIYGVSIGFLTVVIRTFGAYPEGMSFAILIMNAFTPLINNYCKPKRFGEVVKK
jgi:electron transport complex protein RnfD